MIQGGSSHLGWWAAHRWWVLLALAFVASLLGFWGFHAERYHGYPRWWYDAAYGTALLFLADLRLDHGPFVWSLELARWLAPAVAASSALLALGELFREETSLLRLAWLKDHVVICGADQKGTRIARAYLTAEPPDRAAVVIIERDPSSPALAACRALGAVVLAGDASDTWMLRRARVERAARVFALCGDDGANADIAAMCAEVVGDRPRETPLSVFCHVADPPLREALRPIVWQRSGTQGTVSIEIINIDALAVRELLDSPRPLGSLYRDGAPPQLAVVGSNPLAGSLLLRAARQHRLHCAAAAELQRLPVALLAPDAEPFIQRFLGSHPGIDRVLSLVPVRVDEDASLLAVAAATGRTLRAIKPAPARVYVCTDEATGLVLWHHLEFSCDSDGRQPEVVAVVSEAAGLTRLVQPDEPHQAKCLFPMLDRITSPTLYAHTTWERLAMATHEQWRKPNDPPWAETTPENRASSRRAVPESLKLLAQAKLKIQPWIVWPGLVLTDAVIEDVVRREHERWCAYKTSQGWTYATIRDDAAKKNDLLVPWENLPAAEQERNRRFWRHWPQMLADQELQIAPLEEAQDG